MRKKIVAANWKMHKTREQALQWTQEALTYLNNKDISSQIVVATPYVYLDLMSQMFKETEVMVFAQDAYQKSFGAYTGAVSCEMIASVGAKGLLIGHSERRGIFGETNSELKEKVNEALLNKLQIIFCVGETLNERKAETHLETVSEQLDLSLFHLSEDALKNLSIAYEPVWAIGTGETATPDQAEQMHNHIRAILTQRYNDKLANSLSILYGGSVKPENANAIFKQPNIDGGLIGGASLNAKTFLEIVQCL